MYQHVLLETIKQLIFNYDNFINSGCVLVGYLFKNKQYY